MKRTFEERVIVYIDGFNLYYGLKSKWKNRYLWLDVRRLSQNLLREHQSLKQVKYFTSRVSQDDRNYDNWKRQNTYLEALRAMGGVEFYWGQYLRKEVCCPSCKFRWNCPEEKRTDVAIAVEMLTDAQDEKFDTAILISGDSDLVPPVERVIRRHEKRVVVAFPPDRWSGSLSKIASASFMIGRMPFKNSMLPETISVSEDFDVYCPARWKTNLESQ